MQGAVPHLPKVWLVLSRGPETSSASMFAPRRRERRVRSLTNHKGFSSLPSLLPPEVTHETLVFNCVMEVSEEDEGGSEREATQSLQPLLPVRRPHRGAYRVCCPQLPCHLTAFETYEPVTGFPASPRPMEIGLIWSLVGLRGKLREKAGEGGYSHHWVLRRRRHDGVHVL
ncbi:hypothetical protein B296_00004540 [Ensete ventricosum]|uniref:Uncharacterized protein n=1 Tax=Ensete ventricosum TaxID=4639 RepID=A0A427B884_ENSVE|nr:hypothetical protein B296_00004540 [Ensete ventricosum]